MRLNVHPGTALTMAYAIAKRSPGSEFFSKPTHSAKAKPRAKGSQPMSVKSSFSSRLNTSRVAMEYLEAGSIISAAERRGPGFRDWSRFIYNPDHDFEWSSAGARVAKRLFCAWAYGNRRPVRLPAKTFEDLAAICAYNSIARYSSGQKQLTPTEICRHLGYKSADDANFYRTLKPHYEFMELILDIHNTRTLFSVRERLEMMRGEKKTGQEIYH